ncbi:MAG: multidrug ABC transporter ATP-binding protein [Desulfobulbus propionicus]|nr:MAG: multidrug ABC transporter ATP-binding protein [Desulfobulbus propionicus]
MNDASKSGFKRALQVVGPLFRQHPYRLLCGIIAIVFVDCLQLYIPRILKHGIDSLAAQTADLHSLLFLGSLVILASFCMLVLRFTWRYLIVGFSRIVENKIRDRLYAHILSLDQPFFKSRATGDLTAHSSNDLNAVQMACGMGLVAGSDALIMTVLAIMFLLVIDVRLTLAALSPMPFLAAATFFLSSRLHYRFTQVQEQFSTMTAFSLNTLRSIQLVQGYTLERLQQRRFARLGKDYIYSNIRVAMVQGILHPLSILVGNLTLVLVLYYGGSLVIRQDITLGDFVAVIAYMYLMIWPMMAVGWVAMLVQRGVTSLVRVHHLLEQRPVVERKNAAFFPAQRELVCRLHTLTFSYNNAAVPALSAVNCTISPGITGIAGRTGSGKSTLCSLLLRLYPVEDGMICINDTDVNDLKVASLRENISYVSQEPVLFSGSIADNIAFGRPDASRQEIRLAACDAAIHDEIMQLPGGYDARIGERGVKLSGGQRQRMALARALLCRRPMLIIDDGLTGIDVETEQTILRRIAALDTFSSVIIVSHRLNVLCLADNILVLEQGKMAAFGRHEDLLAHPLYRTMMEKREYA